MQLPAVSAAYAGQLIKDVSNQCLMPSFALRLKTCQIREVINQELLPVIGGSTAPCCEPLACEPLACEPLACEPLGQAGAAELAPLFRAVADPMRLRLLSLIACHDGGESCVCDLLAAFDVTAPSVSYHLKILREAGLISSERRGTWVYYRVNPEVLARMSGVLAPPAGTDAAG